MEKGSTKWQTKKTVGKKVEEKTEHVLKMIRDSWAKPLTNTAAPQSPSQGPDMPAATHKQKPYEEHDFEASAWNKQLLLQIGLKIGMSNASFESEYRA